MNEDLSMLVLRLVPGALMAGHGAQKLFGALEGPGRQGTAQMMEAMGLRPGKHWGLAAGVSEFAGGTLTALGFLNPLGPIATLASMAMATGTAHWGKPVWVTSGGAELPLAYSSIAVAIAMGGPGRISLDHALGIRVPAWVTAGAALSAAGLVAYGLTNRAMANQASEQDTAQTSQQDTPSGDVESGRASA